MRWRSVMAFAFGISVFSTTGAFPSPLASDHHRWQHRAIQPWVPSGRLERPNHDPNYIGWSRLPEADRGCSGPYGCSHAQVGGGFSGRSPARGWVYFGPQYTYVPGRGVIDEACNLPTSACPNTQRDGQ
jgi:hypothetical protein